MEEPSPPTSKSKQSGRSSRHMSSSRASSVMSQLAQLPESDSADAKWRRYLVDLLGEEGADYFINPKPKEHKIIIDKALYGCHGLDDAWQLLREKADSRMRSKFDKKPIRNRRGEEEDEDDRAYNSFARYLLQKGRVFPPRIFSEKADSYKQQLVKLSDRRARMRAAKYNQETGVSFRAAIVNTERCAHLIEQASNKGTGAFAVDRKTDGSVFYDDFDEDSELEHSFSTSVRMSSMCPSASSTRKKAIRKPKFIFLSSDEPVGESKQSWSRNSRDNGDRDTLPSFLANLQLANASERFEDDVDDKETPDFPPTVEKWEPLGLSAAAEWGKVMPTSSV